MYSLSQQTQRRCARALVWRLQTPMLSKTSDFRRCSWWCWLVRQLALAEMLMLTSLPRPVASYYRVERTDTWRRAPAAPAPAYCSITAAASFTHSLTAVQPSLRSILYTDPQQQQQSSTHHRLNKNKLVTVREREFFLSSMNKNEWEWECKCLTCSQKPTGSHSLVYCTNQTER